VKDTQEKCRQQFEMKGVGDGIVIQLGDSIIE
jgi:hypothetical protein